MDTPKFFASISCGVKTQNLTLITPTKKVAKSFTQINERGFSVSPISELCLTVILPIPVWRIRDAYPGSRIPDPDVYPSRIPDPGSRIPDPGSKNSNKREG